MDTVIFLTRIIFFLTIGSGGRIPVVEPYKQRLRQKQGEAMAILETQVETGYGKIPYEQAHLYSLPPSITVDQTPGSVIESVKTLFDHAIHGDSSVGHLRAPSRFGGALVLAQHNLRNCDVYSVQFQDTMHNPQDGRTYNRGAVNFIHPTDGVIEHPLVHTHFYVKGAWETRETPAIQLSGRSLNVAKWTVRFAKDL